MKKQVKIKRYKNIYSSNNPFSSPLSIVITLVILAAIGVAGWFLYTPIYNAVFGGSDNNQPEASSVPAAVSEASESVSQSEVSTAAPAPTLRKGLKAVYAPQDMLTDTAEFNTFLSDISASGVNAVVVTAKGKDGYLMYRSQLEAASQTQATNTFDPVSISNAIKDAGFEAIVLVEAFHDPLYPRIERAAAVYYMDSDLTWLDNSPDLGGRPWLNPYAPEATDYLIAIGSELATAGFSEVIYSSVQFPSGVGQNKATYGEGNAGPAIQPLTDFVQNASSSISENGANVSIMIPAGLAMTGNDVLYGGLPTDIVANNYVIEIFPSNFPPNSVINGVTIASPATDYATVTENVCDYLVTTHPDKEFTAMISGTDANQSLISQIGLEGQINALGEEINGYIVYNPGGYYITSGIK